jgi:hypothetical protein
VEAHLTLAPTPPAEATKPGRPCPDCDGLGRVEISIPGVGRGQRDDGRVIGSRWDVCMTCLGRQVVEEQPQTKG